MYLAHVGWRTFPRWASAVLHLDEMEGQHLCTDPRQPRPKQTRIFHPDGMAMFPKAMSPSKDGVLDVLFPPGTKIYQSTAAPSPSRRNFPWGLNPCKSIRGLKSWGLPRIWMVSWKISQTNGHRGIPPWSSSEVQGAGTYQAICWQNSHRSNRHVWVVQWHHPAEVPPGRSPKETGWGCWEVHGPSCNLFNWNGHFLHFTSCYPFWHDQVTWMIQWFRLSHLKITFQFLSSILVHCSMLGVGALSEHGPSCASGADLRWLQWLPSSRALSRPIAGFLWSEPLTTGVTHYRRNSFTMDISNIE